jgi:LuxR family transcriptional regulator, maltose regulon positive regulatory protein
MSHKYNVKLAKLTRPKLHKVLARTRLFALLDAGRERSLTWVVGPPGAGKTALAASYLDARKLSGVWYHLDASDYDPATFFHYLSQTLERAEGQAPLPVITAEHLADLRAFARYYFREFYNRLKAPDVLVFDNYHEIPAISLLHGVLEQAAQEAPDDIALIIISREEPPPEFARLDALDRLARIEWNDLKLTLEEATAIAALRFELDAPTLRSLYDISKGWAAGLTLALERMKRSAADAGRIQGEALESVFNYFAGQIFKTAEPEVRDFLMRSALLQRMTADMAAQLSGNDHAEKWLDYFYRRRLFTDRRGGEPYSYQYHDLFRAFLLDQLKQTFGETKLNELRQQAGQLLEQGQRYDDAFTLYQSAKDWGSITNLVLAQAQTLIGQGRGETLREWIKALPEPIVEQTPWVSYWQGISFLGCAAEQAQQPLARAYWKLEREGNVPGRIACCSAMVMAYMDDLTDFRPLTEWVDRLNGLLRNASSPRSALAELQTNAALAYSCHACRHRADFYEPAVARALDLLESDLPVNDKVVPACLLLNTLREAGRIADCNRIIAAMEPFLANGRVGPNLGYWAQATAWTATSGGDRVSALAACNRAREIFASHSISGPARYVYTNLMLAAIAFQADDVSAAKAHVAQLESYLNPKRRLERGWAAWIRSIVASMRDDWEGAIKFAQLELNILSSAGAVFHLYYAHLHLAGGLIGLKRYGDAHAEIEKARAILVDTFEFRNLADVDLMAAWLALNQGDIQRFDTLVRGAFDLLKRTELHACLWYVDQRILPAVLTRALERDIEPQQISDYIRHLDLRAPPDAGLTWPWPIKIFLLGRFDVLHNDAPLESSRKPAKKPLALLKLLACAGGAPVPVAHTLDALWPESEADSAKKSFDVTLHRLRDLLGSNDAVKLAEERVSLDRSRVWVDAWEFQALCRNASTCDESQRAASLYQGALLPEEFDAAWSVSYREKLHDNFNRLVCAQASQLESQRLYDEALTWYARGLEADDLVETMHQGVMRCYLQLDRRADALAAFQRLRRTLAAKLRTLPSGESLELADKAQSAGA